MRKQLYFALAVVLIGIAAVATPALAGGWATFTIDRLPANIRAGELFTLGFVARGHGQTPFTMPDKTARFVFHNAAMGETITVAVQATGKEGHHVAKVVLPGEGLWAWELQPDPYPPVKFEPLLVGPAVDAPASTPWPAWSAVGRGVALVMAQRGHEHRPLWLGTGTAGALLLAAGDLWLNAPAVPAQVNAGATPDLHTYGKALFAAKGCMTCHYHGEMANEWVIGVGPDLSNYRNSPEFLHIWLKDPSSVRDAKMPTLGLAEDEIEALVAFINHD